MVPHESCVFQTVIFSSKTLPSNKSLSTKQKRSPAAVDEVAVQDPKPEAPALSTIWTPEPLWAVPLKQGEHRKIFKGVCMFRWFPGNAFPDPHLPHGLFPKTDLPMNGPVFTQSSHFAKERHIPCLGQILWWRTVLGCETAGTPSKGVCKWRPWLRET